MKLFANENLFEPIIDYLFQLDLEKEFGFSEVILSGPVWRHKTQLGQGAEAEVQPGRNKKSHHA